MSDWIDSHEVLERLNIKAQTLYAYVSRGLVRTKADIHNSRRKLYATLDIDALARRQAEPGKHTIPDFNSPHSGALNIKTQISRIDDGCLYFGKTPATECAKTHSFESITRQHWGIRHETRGRVSLYPIPNRETPRLRALIFLSQLIENFPTSSVRDQDTLATEAAGLLSGFTNAVLGVMYDGPIHRRIQSVWGLPDKTADIIRQTLVLLSDEGLDAPALAVRVAASSGAPLPACMLSGLSAATGPVSNLSNSNAFEFFMDCMRLDNLEEAIQDRNSRPAAEFGYGHAGFPDGDQRAEYLISQINPSQKTLQKIAECEQILGKKANIATALSALKYTFGLRDHTLFSLRAIARMSGWLGHAIEQGQSQTNITSRINYCP